MKILYLIFKILKKELKINFKKPNNKNFNNHLAKIGFPKLIEEINSGGGYFHTEVAATKSNIFKERFLLVALALKISCTA